jgi:alpha-1,6-mannosyltransferase
VTFASLGPGQEDTIATPSSRAIDRGRYLLLCGALFLLIAQRSWTDAWLGDFWVHLPALKELAARPFHPRNPLFGGDRPYAFLSPYAWMLGLASRLGHLRPIEVLFLQGLVNLALLLSALHAFVTTWLGRRAAAVYALLFMLFLWGRDPWLFSGFFHLRSLSFVFPYPSTFAAGLALACLAAFPAALAAGSRAWAVLGVAVLALLWIIHPINALFLCIGLLVCSVTAPPPRQRVSLALAVGASVALAFCWPLFPVWQLWFAEREVVDLGNDTMYGDALPRVAPALVGLPWLLLRLRRTPRDRLAWLGLTLALLVACGGALRLWSYGRLISHVVLVLQVALADACAALEERLARLRRGAVLRHLLAPSLAALLIAGAWPAAVRPILEEAGRGDPLWLGFLEQQVGADDVVLTDLETCWYVPSFSGRVVAYPMRLPFVPDHDARVGAVGRFFERGVPQAERLELIERFGVAYVLLAKARFADWWTLLAELQPLGRVVYSSPEYELLRVDSQRLAMPGRRLEEYGLPHREAPAASDGAVDPSLVVPHPNNRLQHLGGGARRARVVVHHRAALVAIGDANGGGLARLSEREDASHPFVLLEGDRSQ